MRLDVRQLVGRVASPRHLRQDVSASLVVFLVALPLSLGIALASGAPPAAGLVAAAVGGIVAGALGGSPLQISGPAAGLTVIVAGHVDQFGWRATCAVTVAAGMLQLLLGLSRVARAVLAISPTVVHAMMAGIGITIVLAQLQVVLGARPEPAPYRNLLELPGRLAGAPGAGALLGTAVVAVLVAWPRLPTWGRLVPAPLVAVVAATALAELARIDVARLELSTSLGDAVTAPTLPGGSWGTMAVAAVTLAAVASVETLLTAVAVERMKPGSRTSYDRELLGQGAANTVSGLLGGLPVSGVIVRSTANVTAGATGRASAVLHGLWVLLFSVFLVGLVQRIPLAVLAGLLVVVGCQLVKPSHWRAAGAHGERPVYVATLVGVLTVGLLEGVVLGVAVAVLLMARRVVRARVRLEPAPEPVPGSEPVARAEPDLVAAEVFPASPGRTHWTVVAEGTLSFLSVPRLSRLLAQVPAGSVVTLHLLVDFLDHAVADHLRNWKQQHEASGGKVLVDDMALAPRSLR